MSFLFFVFSTCNFLNKNQYCKNSTTEKVTKPVLNVRHTMLVITYMCGYIRQALVFCPWDFKDDPPPPVHYYNVITALEFMVKMIIFNSSDIDNALVLLSLWYGGI